MIPNDVVNCVRDIYESNDFISLHEPTFGSTEEEYVLNTVRSTFVSSVGQYVEQFEQGVADYVKHNNAVAVVNGTAALHAALHYIGVGFGDLVITQAFTFVATCNAIKQLGAEPVFVDINHESLSLCPQALANFLEEQCQLSEQGVCVHKASGKVIKAVVPMHTFGHPAKMDEIQIISQKWGIKVVEDAAESLGSLYNGKHTGTLGDHGIISFNGNKIITCGAGGIILSKHLAAANAIKHLTTTAKKPHSWEFEHDQVAFNYRMPNLNAALGCAQLEKLSQIVEQKRALAKFYHRFFGDSEYQFVCEPKYAQSNYWLNALVCQSEKHRNELLEFTNSKQVMTRPAWRLMHTLPMYSDCIRGDLSTSVFYQSRIVNIPSSYNYKLKVI
ncbi:LegC family aminotransferase [Pseudoalteromonas spongiae]|uniref:LegC family aminotransferase n=1 Tax=Pseudoalteromonas spongiae TaxID=298657 RepID=UPI00110BCD67|nr:LegC family aminotransferase [Pseudoalteromonas spongiae]TMO83677.1 aminotransferase DegT [Pseudoalteromonas spongiae]